MSDDDEVLRDRGPERTGAPGRAGHERRTGRRQRGGDGGLLVDIRYAELRERDGIIPGALIVERNELEWRLDPTGEAPRSGSDDITICRSWSICNEGYASSLAALSLRELGLHRATDLEGGFQAWRTAGLPVGR